LKLKHLITLAKSRKYSAGGNENEKGNDPAFYRQRCG
jgi:hypothetical protein